MVSHSQNRQATPQPAAPSTIPSQGLILLVLSAAAFMASLDLFIVNVAFNAIRHDFAGSSLADVSWILNGYATVYAALLVPLGRLADRYGQKGGFLIGLTMFVLASGACALSPGPWWLVCFRLLQAAGAAALTPTSLSLLLGATEPARRARAVRIWAATGALAAAVGPVVGGALVQAAWQWVFIVNVPIGVATIIATMRYVPASRDARAEGNPDLVGAAILAVSIAALALGVVNGPSWGWSDIKTVVSFVVAVMGTASFVLRTMRFPEPVIPPSMLSVQTFAWSNISSLVFSFAFAAGLLANILWLQQVWGYGPMRVGLAVVPGPVMVQVTALISHRLIRRGVTAGAISAIGCALLATGYLLIATTVGHSPHWATEMLPGQLLIGSGVGFALPTILSTGTSDLPAQRTATGSAVLNMSRQVGSVVGVSVLVSIVGSPRGYSEAHGAFRAAWITIAATACLAAVASFGMNPHRRSIDQAQVPAAEVA
ncbi:MFS transporter [Rudaeicoccus suwonensis]|uniref:EmrB/QacA subfamily drug resistance transporter n=1 Tax=Rudaeicoccus suwonensis TaxID=657409 RepID=A0A561E860_9MICO|nr:MFS transporter [Rudaeicoccus suwonensis]TWE11801.1 EmrB/QacA subfamily drug resistance transporter [Rudaeicoccus suwonensis]